MSKINLDCKASADELEGIKKYPDTKLSMFRSRVKDFWRKSSSCLSRTEAWPKREKRRR